MFKEVADIKTSDQLHLPVPVAKFETVVAKPSEIPKGDGAGAEQTCGRNPLRCSGCLRGQYALRHKRRQKNRLGCSPDEPHAAGRPQQQAERMRSERAEDLGRWQRPEADAAFVLRPLHPENDGNFNVYDDIRKKLVAAGVPENEIEFIHNADTEAKKAALFSKYAPAMCASCWGSAGKKWAQEPMCSSVLWQCIIWMSAGNPVI